MRLPDTLSELLDYSLAAHDLIDKDLYKICHYIMHTYNQQLKKTEVDLVGSTMAFHLKWPRTKTIVYISLTDYDSDIRKKLHVIYSLFDFNFNRAFYRLHPDISYSTEVSTMLYKLSQKYHTYIDELKINNLYAALKELKDANL